MNVLDLLAANTPDCLMILRSELRSSRATTLGETKYDLPPERVRLSPP